LERARTGSFVPGYKRNKSGERKQGEARARDAEAHGIAEATVNLGGPFKCRSRARRRFID